MILARQSLNAADVKWLGTAFKNVRINIGRFTNIDARHHLEQSQSARNNEEDRVELGEKEQGNARQGT